MHYLEPLPNNLVFLSASSALAIVLAFGAPSAASAQNNSDIDEIVVTAQKREQNVVDVPISISVVGQNEFENTGSVNLSDLSEIIPNFSLETVGEYDTVFIRGVGGGGRSIGFSSRAGVYLDGIPTGQVGALDQSLLDLQRVEVLRGPQGHLFGQNTVSGAVSLVTKQPENDFFGNVSFLYGNKDAIEIAGTVNVPLTETLYFKLSGSHREREGFTTNIFDGEDIDNVDAQSVRGQLRFVPIPNLTIDVTADYSLADERRIVGENISGTFGETDIPLSEPFEIDFNVAPFQRRENYGASFTLNYEFENGINLTALSGYRDALYRIQNDIDYSAADFFSLNYPDQYEQFSQELRLVSPASQRARWVVGAFYMNESASTDRVVTFGANNDVLPFGFPPNSTTTVGGGVETNSHALFGALDFDMTEKLTLNLGARYTRSEQDLLFNSDGTNTSVVNIVTVPDFRDSRSDEGFTPTVGMTYALTEDTNVFVKYSRGFKAGGYNIDYLNADEFDGGIDFDDETVDSYEAGIKGSLPGSEIGFEFTAFRSDYDDYQLNQFVEIAGGVTIIQLENAASVRTEGFEASLNADPLPWWGLSAALGYVEAEFQDFPNGGGPGVNLAGERLPFAPRLTTTIASDMTFPVSEDFDLGLYVEHNYRSSQFSEEDNRPDTFIANRHLVNARVKLSPADEAWSIAAFADNLLDEDFLERRYTDFFGTLAVSRGLPRTYGVETRLKF